MTARPRKSPKLKHSARRNVRTAFPKKSLGQNFLMHARTAARIADAAGLTESDTVLEIGPGTGMLTAALLARAARVVAVEADPALARLLEEKFEAEIARGRLDLREGDIRAFDPASIEGPYALVANIPYYITGEILRDFLGCAHKPERMTLLVQKEVAERIARSTKGSLLSVSVKVFGTPRYAFTVPRGAFVPAPGVDSAVLTITDIHDPFEGRGDEARFFAAVKAGFAHKRKRLARNLASLAHPEAIRTAFEALKIPEKARAEDLSIDTWKSLAHALH